MKRIIKLISLFFIFPKLFSPVNAQILKNGTLSGNFQLNAQSYSADSIIDAPKVNEKMLTNAYANFIYTSENITAGLRYEAYLNPLLGYDKRYTGSGIPYRFVNYHNEKFSFTVGNFYEQFGSGLILRSYEEKNLGIDNSIDGVSVHYSPFSGLKFKSFVGKQRSFFQLGNGIIRGIDGELNLKESGILDSTNTNLILGASFVSKYQADEDPIYILPENVGAASFRANLILKRISINAEYAQKANDPSADNRFIYKKGSAALVNINYTQKGLGILLSAKVVDNMSFRSDRNANLNNLSINYLPTISKPHAYTLPAIYPYATQNLGEEGIQGEIFYKLKRKTLLGGKYGTDLTLNISHIRNITKTPRLDAYAYDVDWTKIGDEVYFQDINLKLRRKINKNWKLKLAYYSLQYNKDVIEGVAGYGTVHAQVFVSDITYKIKSRHYLRWEAQYLTTKQDHGDWAYSLLEYTISPHYFFTLYDQYNIGTKDEPQNIHYPYVAAGYTHDALQIRFGYGRQREGIVCVGGVCRAVPASNGLSMEISYTF